MTEDTEKKEILLKEFEGKLDKILAKIEEKETTQLVDILTAILLSLATIGSAWCAYQATLWGGVQTFELAAQSKAGRLSSENVIKANQKITMDATMVIKYIDANEEGNFKMRDFYFSRFDPILQNATLEWLKLDPFNNQNAPNSPMRMPSYKLKEDAEAINQLNLSIEKLASANEANRTSDRYVLLTVLFAAVLFFGGIASTLQSNLIRNVCLILSAVIFCMTLFVLMNMPVTTI
jgi:hypothetical protein